MPPETRAQIYVKDTSRDQVFYAKRFVRPCKSAQHTEVRRQLHLDAIGQQQWFDFSIAGFVIDHDAKRRVLVDPKQVHAVDTSGKDKFTAVCERQPPGRNLARLIVELQFDAG